MINLNDKTFVSIQNTPNGQVSGETRFLYHQKGNRVWATYSGGSIEHGHLIALMDKDGNLEMRYHHIDIKGELMTGKCYSTPEILSDGRIRYHEKWQWTSSDESQGESIIEEDIP